MTKRQRLELLDIKQDLLMLALAAKDGSMDAKGESFQRLLTTAAERLNDIRNGKMK